MNIKYILLQSRPVYKDKNQLPVSNKESVSFYTRNAFPKNNLIIRRYLRNISDKTLSVNLKELEADNLIIRREFPQIPPKVEYSLSERGKSLMTVLDKLCEWGEKNKE